MAESDTDAVGGERLNDRWTRDLQDDLLAGRNAGLEGPHPEKGSPRTAFDVKDAHRRLQTFTDDELKRIPIMPVGSRLEQGATYLDLRVPAPHELTATADLEAGPEHWYVPKSEVDYQLWNRLIDVDNPERLGEADES